MPPKEFDIDLFVRVAIGFGCSVNIERQDEIGIIVYLIHHDLKDLYRAVRNFRHDPGYAAEDMDQRITDRLYFAKYVTK